MKSGNAKNSDMHVVDAVCDVNSDICAAWGGVMGGTPHHYEMCFAI